MSEENKAMVRRLFLGMVNDGLLDMADDAFALEYRDHSPVSEPMPGPAGFKRRVSELRRALDARMNIYDMTSEQDRVAFRWHLTGKHVGDFAGYAPTGRNVRLTGLNLERIADGRIVEHWSEYDRHALFEQLGADAQPSARRARESSPR